MKDIGPIIFWPSYFLMIIGYILMKYDYLESSTTLYFIGAAGMIIYIILWRRELKKKKITKFN